MTPRVTAVIPTTGRPEVAAAIESARRQEGVEVEVVVIVDSTTGDIDPRLIIEADEVHFTGGGRGAGYARNIGVSASSGEYIAFLDDDDEWLPSKSRLQLQSAEGLRKAGRLPVVASRVLTRLATRDPLSVAVPEHVYDGGPVADYLFTSRGLSFQRPALHCPTLLTLRQVAVDTRWDEGLRRHQDWDWLIRVTTRPEVMLVQMEAPLAIVTVGSPGSISATPDWESSWAWALSIRESLSPEAYGSLLAGQTLRHALAARNLRAARMIVREARTRGRPAWGSLLLGTSGVVPRKALEIAAHYIGRIGERRMRSMPRRTGAG